MAFPYKNEIIFVSFEAFTSEETRRYIRTSLKTTSA